MLVTPLKERERRSTWKDGGKDTPVIQLKTAFIEIDGQPMMNRARSVPRPSALKQRPNNDATKSRVPTSLLSAT